MFFGISARWRNISAGPRFTFIRVLPDWPATGPGIKETFSPMGAWGIPALNTALLLTSGVTLTWAHWGLLKNKRTHLIWGLVLTIALGMIFLGFQIYEYSHAYSDLNLKLSMGAYGATFYMRRGYGQRHGQHHHVVGDLFRSRSFRRTTTLVSRRGLHCHPRRCLPWSPVTVQGGRSPDIGREPFAPDMD
jgi:heme/copper-type cytochrome/quinol oxidase subunit 3